MTHPRSLVLGAFLGSAVTFFSMGFVACQRSESESSAKASATGAALPGQNPEDLEKVLAEIDGEKITVGEFQERINKQSPYIRARYTSLERKKEFLDNLIRFEVLAKAAKERGFDKDPEVVRTMKQVMIQKLMKEEFETRVRPEDITEEEMRKFYEEHHDEYNKPEEVRVSAIVVKDKARAEKVAKEAKGPKGADNRGFRDLVTQYSEDESTKQRGGDLRYFPKDTTDVPAAVAQAAFALGKTGDVAGPIATDKGYYIIKLTSRRKALSKSFDEVKRQIQNRIYRDKRTQAMEDFVNDLRNKAKVTIHEENLAKVQVDTTGPTVPGQDPHDDIKMKPAPGPQGNPQ